MKKYYRIFFLTVAGFLSISTFAQSSSPQPDTMMRYYSRLANSTNDVDKSELETQLYKFLKSSKEQDWLTARRFFYQLKKINTADSIAIAAKVKFPLGQLVRDEKVDTIFKEKDPLIKEKLYHAWITKFPPSNFGNELIIYDYARNSISTAFAEADDLKKALLYANLIESPVWKGEGWAGTASVLVRKEYLKEAAELYRKAIDNSFKYMTTNRNDPGAGFAAMGYIGYNTSLAEILMKQENYPEALIYIRQAHDSSSNVRSNVNELYAKILMKLNKELEAFNIIDEAVKAGQATKEMKETLKKLYVNVKGSNEGYEDYMATVSNVLAEKIRKDLARQIIKEPAPQFVLKDVNGNTVALHDLMGKTVVLDFWATWCVPCKRSFPAMKMAVEKFQSDPDVKFLFIHTWEKEDSATFNAKKYIVDNNFPFEVLMDLRDSEGNNKVVEDYKVSAIPTKFVIDKKGNIRFKFTGASGGDDAVVEEIVAMVELANKED